jgi:hypothetical protein
MTIWRERKQPNRDMKKEEEEEGKRVMQRMKEGESSSTSARTLPAIASVCAEFGRDFVGGHAEMIIPPPVQSAFSIFARIPSIGH